MATHKNIIGLECLHGVDGSERLVVKMAVCDMFQAGTGPRMHARTTYHKLLDRRDK